LPDLGVQGLQIYRCRRTAIFGCGKHLRGAGHELAPPLRDLMGMDVNALGQLGQRLGALQRGEGHLGFEHG